LGNPRHFGIELPQRCLAIVEELWSEVEKIHGGKTPELGPLTTTFLVSMSMPIINLPVERIERQISNGNGEGYMDDRPFGQEAVEAFQLTVQRGIFSNAPFFEAGVWRFTKDSEPRDNYAYGLPARIATALQQSQALEDAKRMAASQWISTLRNALAHGGILYLDARGQSTDGRPVKNLAFVSGTFNDGVCPNKEETSCRGIRGDLKSLKILQISELDYREFLKRWVAWIGSLE
jgi:hypothetical protein